MFFFYYKRDTQNYHLVPSCTIWMMEGLRKLHIGIQIFDCLKTAENVMYVKYLRNQFCISIVVLCNRCSGSGAMQNGHS